MNIRHPLAAVLGVAGILAGSVAALGSSASAAGDELTGTTVFNCVSDAAPTKPFTWNGTLTLSATRPDAASTVVTVVAGLSDMAGKVPLNLGKVAVTEKLVLSLAGTATTLTGSGDTTIKKDTDFSLPDVQGTLASSATTLAVTTTSFEFTIPTFASTTACSVTSGASLGDLPVVIGVAPVPSLTPTTTTSATATPSASGSVTPSSDANAGKPASGKAAFACKLTIGSEFDYDAKISVSGFRAKSGDDVSLVATMSNLPGIAPVPIDGPMDYTLDAEVGGKKVTLTSTGDVSAAAKETVPVADLSGSVAADDDELEVAVSAFTFNFPSAGIGADCKVARTVLGKMTVGSEPIDSDPSSSSTTSTSTLPKTGGGDSMPVVALWALALTLLGAAGLLCVPRTRRQH
jgi:LPXTG-motif cell wall-anchored protein